MRQSVYARTRLLLMPSRSESFGRVGLEAAASGIPTIASPVEGVPEVLGDCALFLHPAVYRGYADRCVARAKAVWHLAQDGLAAWNQELRKLTNAYCSLA